MAIVDAQVRELIPQLPKARHAAVMGLSDATFPEAVTPLGIWRTNGMPCGDDSGLFALACRINHSCRPNVRWCWRADLGTQHIFAMRPIEEGEELLAAYSKTYARRADRVARLQAQFHFTCACPLCSGPEAGSFDEEMCEIQANIDALPAACQTDMKRALALSERNLSLLAAIGLDTPIAMGTAHYEAFQLARATAQPDKAKLHLRRAWELSIHSEGADSPKTAQYAGLLAAEGLPSGH